MGSGYLQSPLTGGADGVSLVAALVASFGVGSVAAYVNRHTSLIPQAGGIYREAAVGQPRYVNPILAGANDLDVDMSRLVYSSLLGWIITSNWLMTWQLITRFLMTVSVHGALA